MGCCTANDPSRVRRSILISPSQFVGGIKTDFLKYYKISNMLGKGTHGESYLCYHRATGFARVVSVKPKDEVDAYLSRFLNELGILRQIDHPNIVKLLEVYEDSKRYYIVTELLTGGELLDRIVKHKAFTERNAAVIMKQVLSAIGYCHSMRIVHRDIKPQNILFENDDPNSQVKIIDFATSQQFDPASKMRNRIGTPYYIAPEVLRRCYDEKCDVWSCGVVLYILLGGCPPFKAENEEQLLIAIGKGEYKMQGSPWSSVSPLAKDLVKNMLMFDPEKRYTAAQALGHEWIKEYAKEEVDPETTKSVLSSLKKFTAQHKLQQAALTYMVSQLTTKSEKESLRAVFMSLDRSGKGKLTKQDLVDGYKQVYGEIFGDDDEMAKIMKNIDSDHSGFIDYTEFAVATINKKTLLSKERLSAAFRMFDRDGSGKISLEEIKTVLSGNEGIPHSRWEEVLKEANIAGTGEITEEEFISMMQKLLSST